MLDQIELKYYKNENNLSLNELFRDSFGWEKGLGYTKIENIKINNNSVFRVELDNPHDGEKDPSIWIPIDSGFYKIAGNHLNNRQEKLLEDIFESIKIENNTRL